MSLASWKAEFYPAPVSRIKTVTGAVEHSLRKWKGLRAAALRRHGVEDLVGYVKQPDNPLLKPFPIDDSTCALCWILDAGDRTQWRDCQRCVLTQARGGYPCTAPAPEEPEDRSPWLMFTRDGDPEPMIKLLEKALRSLKKKL
jgi:hypothetical protein